MKNTGWTRADLRAVPLNLRADGEPADSSPDTQGLVRLYFGPAAWEEFSACIDSAARFEGKGREPGAKVELPGVLARLLLDVLSETLTGNEKE